jgi:galactose mutarotase-like enzyme
MSDWIVLENEFYEIKIHPSGAEIHSVYSKKINREIIWQAKPEVWSRHAPVLFPIVGKLKENKYQYKNNWYNLPQHGFARDQQFDVIASNIKKAVFLLSSTEETKQHFPFNFNLKITYEIMEESIHCFYQVLNTGENDLYFSIGAHPGFICPIDENEKWTDYSIIFEQIESANRLCLEDGLLNDDTVPFLTNQNSIPLNTNLFDQDALVFKQLNSEALFLKSKKHCLKFSWHNMPYLGIWTKKGQHQFICIEPWHGVADSKNSSGNITKKEGIIKLNQNEEFNCNFGFSVLN